MYLLKLCNFVNYRFIFRVQISTRCWNINSCCGSYFSDSPCTLLWAFHWSFAGFICSSNFSISFTFSHGSGVRQWVTDSVTIHHYHYHSPSRLAWSEGWRSPGAESAFIIWTTWSLVMALRHDDSTINIVVILLLLLLLLSSWRQDQCDVIASTARPRNVKNKRWCHAEASRKLIGTGGTVER